ncbi:MAG: fibronectin type III domain-containing protein [Steroidobacteraceae bacterium]
MISVSNGSASAALAPFAITVKPATSGSATLTWTAPVNNTNGSALTDLAGYHIYYGASPSAMSTVIDVASAGTTSYTISSLASGTWYFAVNAYTTDGTESALSNTGSKSIP